MVAVAIAALDFAVIRATCNSRAGELLMLGALPMANVLAVGMLIAQRSPGRRPFLLGFEVFGAMALALFVALVFLGEDDISLIDYYLVLLVDPLEKHIGRDRPWVFIPILIGDVVTMLGLPQLAFAFMGGSLSRRFKISITRR
jgi:hypothetical protein